MKWIKNTHKKAMELTGVKSKQNQFLILLVFVSTTIILWKQTGFTAWGTIDFTPFITVLGLGVLLFMFKRLLRFLLYTWFFVGSCISDVLATIVLFSLFFLVLTPIGLVLKRRNQGWVKQTEKNDFNNMF